MRTTVVVIGAGHSGLAMSRRLTERSIDHVVLERGEVANSWSTQRWASLRLLTPNWLTRLPGLEYSGDLPDGFLSAAEVATFVRDYAAAIAAPVQTNTSVTSVAAAGSGYLVKSDQGSWAADAVVLASGASTLPNLPAIADATPSAVQSLSPLDYTSPDQLADGGVLVVGASATGVQLAEELRRAGRRVVLSVSEHVRMPRTYRGRDIFWWMDRSGVLDERYDGVDDIVRARHVPSPQLIGTPHPRAIDLNALRGSGVELVGRLGAIRDGLALFSGGLANAFRLADLKQDRLLDRFDRWAEANGIHGIGDVERPDPTEVGANANVQLDLVGSGIGTVLWATGFRPDYSWLELPVLDSKGRMKHDGGVVSGAPGVYLLGASLLRRRRSTYIDGAAQDTDDLATHLHAALR